MDHTFVAWCAHHIRPVYAVVLFCWGACTGSLLNVVILRLPRGESLLFPPSHCPACGKRIGLLELVPILNYLVLCGRCRGCGARISPLYPVVELLTACVCAGIGYANATNAFGAWENAGVMAVRLVFACSLIVLACIDLTHRIVPNRITYPGIGFGLTAAIFFPALHGAWPEWFPGWPAGAASLAGAVAGLVFGAGLVQMMRWGGRLLFRQGMQAVREEDPYLDGAVGQGDIKLMAYAGCILGVEAVFLATMFGILFAAVGGIVWKLSSGHVPQGEDASSMSLREQLRYRWATGVCTMPFGPFLATTCLCMELGGRALLLR